VSQREKFFWVVIVFPRNKFPGPRYPPPLWKTGVVKSVRVFGPNPPVSWISPILTPVSINRRVFF